MCLDRVDRIITLAAPVTPTSKSKIALPSTVNRLQTVRETDQRPRNAQSKQLKSTKRSKELGFASKNRVGETVVLEHAFRSHILRRTPFIMRRIYLSADHEPSQSPFHEAARCRVLTNGKAELTIGLVFAHTTLSHTARCMLEAVDDVF